jgi:hypothetical protein
MFNSNQAFPIGAKVENQPQGLYTRSQGFNNRKKKKKTFQSVCPKLLINAELYGLCIGPKADQKKKGYHHGIWEANLQPFGPMFQAFINSMTSMF